MPDKGILTNNTNSYILKASDLSVDFIDVNPVLLVLPAQHYRPQMFLDNLTSSMQSAASASTSSALVSSSSSHYDAGGHAASSIHETRVITGGGGGAGGGTDSSISDIISLDWATSHWTFSGLFCGLSVWTTRDLLRFTQKHLNWYTCALQWPEHFEQR